MLQIPTSGNVLAASSARPQQGRIGSLTLRHSAIAVAVALGIAVAGTLIGVNAYASQRATVIGAAETSATRFAAVFHDTMASRLEALRLGAEIMARDDRVIDGLRQKDRSSLAKTTVPLFTNTLHPDFGISLLDFTDAAGVMFFRAHRPANFGDDATARTMVTTAVKTRLASSGLEIGQSGPELRAMTPVIAGDSLVGAVEIGSAVSQPLTTAARATSIDYAFAMDRSLAPAIDDSATPSLLVRGSFIYLKTSKPDVEQLLTGLSFDPTATTPTVVKQDGRQVFIQTLPINDVNHRPVTRVTLVRDLTESLRARRTDTILFSSIGTTVVIALVLASLLQFKNIRARLERTFTGRMHDLRAKAADYDRLSQSLRDVKAWKLSFVNEISLLIKDSVSSLHGCVDVARKATRAALVQPGSNASHLKETDRQLHAASVEAGLLDTAVTDQIAMMSARDQLKRFEAEPVDVVAIVEKIADDQRDAFAVDFDATSGPVGVHCAPALLAAALRTLLAAVHHCSDSQQAIVAIVPTETFVAMEISGTEAWNDPPPNLDEAATFAAALQDSRGQSLVLTRLMIEHFGGTLALSERPGTAGFDIVLPVAR